MTEMLLTHSRRFFAENLTKRQFSWKLWGLLFSLMVLLGTGGALAFALTVKNNDNEAPQESASKALPVAVMTVEEVDYLMIERTYTGLITARRSGDLSFKLASGELTNVFVDEGDRIRSGEKLAQLDISRLRAQQEELHAQMEQAKAVLTELENGARVEVKKAAEAEVRNLKAQYDMSVSDLGRGRDLVKRNSISNQEYERLRFSMASLKAQHQAATLRHLELERGTRQEKIDAQRAVVDRLNAALKIIQVDIQDSTLTAPYAGRIAKRHFDEGSVVSPQMPIVRLVEEDHLEARIGIPVDLARTFRVGDSLPLLIHGKEYGGIVQSLSPELDKITRTRMAVIRLHEDAARQVVPGEIVRVKLEEKRNMTGFWVPSTALNRGTRGLWSLYTISDVENNNSTVRQRDVEVLYNGGDQVFVRGTLSGGDRVITSGGHRIVPGQRVSLSDLN